MSISLCYLTTKAMWQPLLAPTASFSTMTYQNTSLGKPSSFSFAFLGILSSRRIIQGAILQDAVCALNQ